MRSCGSPAESGGCQNHYKPSAFATVTSTERARYMRGRALMSRWPGSQGGASEVVTSLNYAPRGAPPRAAPHAHKGYDSNARVPLGARSFRPARPAHMHQQEGGQPVNMSHHGLTGSHSSPRSEGARASGRHAQSRGKHEAGTMGVRPKSQQRTNCNRLRR